MVNQEKSAICRKEGRLLDDWFDAGDVWRLLGAFFAPNDNGLHRCKLLVLNYLGDILIYFDLLHQIIDNDTIFVLNLDKILLLRRSLILDPIQSLCFVRVLDRILVVNRPRIDFVATLANGKAPSRN